MEMTYFKIEGNLSIMEIHANIRNTVKQLFHNDQIDETSADGNDYFIELESGITLTATISSDGYSLEEL